MALDFEYDYLIKELKRKKPKKVLVQLPEGIKTKAIELQEKLSELKIETIFSGETAWGGCCLSLDEAKKVGADLIVHFGHTEFVKTKFPVIYVEIKDDLDLQPLLEKSLESLKQFKKIGLGFSVQHKHEIDKIKNIFEQNNKQIIIPKKAGRVKYDGQIIGCEYSGLKTIQNSVDAFLIIGNKFHSLGASLSLNKPVFLLDVYNNQIEDMNKFKERIIRERAISIDKLKSAINIGIILETKLGQNFGSHEILKEKLEKKGKKVILITMNELNTEKIMNFYNIDAFIELACPRIAIDDFSKYQKPILTFKETMVALGELSWEDFLQKGIL